MKDFHIYGPGLVFSSVCSSLSIEEITERLNKESPTGIKSEWKLSPDENFASGEKNGCACEQYPETHKHYLFSC